MPDSVTIVIWNVETFGQQRKGPRGSDYVPMCNFMARVLHMAQADVFIMQELVQAGEAYLATLRDALDTAFGGNTWKYDYIKGAVATGTTRVNVTSAANLAYVRSAHLEGYAVFWRDGQAQFTMRSTRESLSHGTNPGNVGNMHALSLVLKGRNITNSPLQDNNKWFTATAYDGNANTADSNLDFIANDPLHLIQPTLDECRRPCYCVVELNINGVGTAAKLLPIVVYHTPVNPRVVSAALQAGSFSQQLYRVDDTNQGAATMIQPDHALIGGDFNLDIDEGTQLVTDTYGYLTKAFNQSGANCPTRQIDYPNANDNKTAYRWRKLNGDKVVSNNLTDYLGGAIDHAFLRTSASISLPIPAVNRNYNLLEAVTGGDPNIGNLVADNAGKDIIKAFEASLKKTIKDEGYRGRNVEGTSYAPSQGTKKRKVNDNEDDWQESDKSVRITPEGYLVPHVSDSDDFKDLRRQLKKGYFDTALGTTQFVREFISDHAPVVVKIEFN